MKRLLLVDTTAYLFRAHHATGDLRTADGRPSGGIFGTLNMLDRLRRAYPAEAVACVMDAPGKTFRHEMYPAYKATRPPPPLELIEQIDSLRAFIEALGLPLVAVAGVEADDVIATYARQAAAGGMQVVIASSDKDLMQLVADGQVNLYDGMRERRYDEAAVSAKYGVAPAQMGDYLALVGDTSDNIPGVKKVGAKTAAKWLAQYGALEALRADAASIKGVVGENLRAAIADGTLALSRQLVALKDDVELPQALAQLRPSAPDTSRWQQLCAEYEFKNMAKMLEGAPAAAAPGSVEVETITSEAALERWAQKIRRAGVVAVDTETVGSPVMAAALVGFSLSVTGAEAAYVPLAHSGLEAAQLPQETALAHIAPLLEDEAIVKIMHNGKYDWHVFANAGVRLAGVLEDTKIAAYVQNATADSALAPLAQKVLGIGITEYKEVVDGKKIADFAAVPVEDAAAYAGEDAWVARRLHDALQQRLSPAAKKVYEELDRPLMPLLAAVERSGVKIDGGELSRFAAAMRQEMAQLEEKAHRLAGGAFNLNAPRQLEEILFDQMGARPGKKTGKGARSTDERTLERLAPDFPLAATLLEYRALAKLVGTYAEKLPQQILPSTGRIHTSFSQTAVMTGRLSSSSPNLQNIPIKSEAGRRIRRAFIAGEGMCLLSADYSQIELRLMAHIAGDGALLAAFAAGADIHRQTAAEVFDLPPGEVADEQRRAAKAINFGLIYGMSAYGLARALAVAPPQAQAYIDRYFGRYPQVAAFMEKTRRAGPAQGHVETIFGRRIPIAVQRGGKPAAERVAINAPIQGSAADVMKKAMLAVDAHFRRRRLPAKIILQVHDELVVEAEQSAADEVRACLPPLMANAADLSVALEVDVGSGGNWDEAH